MTLRRSARFAQAALAIPMLLVLSGCGRDTSRALGFTRDPPDEFQVTTRAPLSVPPSLGQLPVPTPGAPRPQESRAAAAILSPGTTATRPSAAEQALVSRAGGSAEPDIRRRVDEESLRLDSPAQSVVDRLMFLRATPAPGIAVDPIRETQRLRENAALGREGTEGETPIVQPRAPGLWERLFGS